jgi:hypothetical protein
VVARIADVAHETGTRYEETTRRVFYLYQHGFGLEQSIDETAFIQNRLHATGVDLTNVTVKSRTFLLSPEEILEAAPALNAPKLRQEALSVRDGKPLPGPDANEPQEGL